MENKPDSEDIETMLRGVSNDTVEFATMRPPDAQFPTLDRRVVTTAPEALVALTRSGDLRVVDELVSLLRVPDRAWAAEVALAAMTGRESDIVNAYATRPDAWATALGQGAHNRWKEWLEGTRARLVWDAQAGLFVAGNGDET